MKNTELIKKLADKKKLDFNEWVQLFSENSEDDRSFAAEIAHERTVARFGKNIYIRGLIEISNFCRNDCLYCGIRRSNTDICRYRMTKEEILACCENGYRNRFRTFVLQGGEDAYYTDEVMCSIVSEIKGSFPDCAVTLSLGERERESYKRLFDAGADRYLLRHETANEGHYGKLHPKELSLKNRMQCLKNLKETGFQTGAGMMIGSPFQTAENLAEDMLFLSEFQPHMVGMGPFIPSKGSVFENYSPGTFEETVFCLSLVRLMLPDALLPATTALGTIKENGREMGILAGANVIMPNLSPSENRKKYMLYNDKIGTTDDVSDGLKKIESSLAEIGYSIVCARGDFESRGRN